MARIFLVDSLFHIYRAYHALPTLLGPEGQPTQVVRGFVGILSTLWKSEKIRHLACVFEDLDAGFRAQIDPNYKAHRPPPPPDLVSQLPLVREACQALGIQSYQQPPFEADDVMASLAVKAVQAGHEVVLVSNDKDLAQLCIHPQISLLRVRGQGKNATLDYLEAAGVEATFGVGPELIPSWLALNGDSVDNIPGIPGIGPKTACKLLKDLGPLPGLLDHLERAGRFAERLEENRERLLCNLDLASLRQDLEIDFSLEAVTPGQFQDLGDFFRRLGLKRQLEALEGGLFRPQSISQLWS